MRRHTIINAAAVVIVAQAMNPGARLTFPPGGSGMGEAMITGILPLSASQESTTRTRSGIEVGLLFSRLMIVYWRVLSDHLCMQRTFRGMIGYPRLFQSEQPRRTIWKLNGLF